MISAILLAAGQSKRMGGENKLTKKIQAVPLIWLDNLNDDSMFLMEQLPIDAQPKRVNFVLIQSLWRYLVCQRYVGT